MHKMQQFKQQRLFAVPWSTWKQRRWDILGGLKAAEEPYETCEWAGVIVCGSVKNDEATAAPFFFKVRI
jgi:hypothetical protein